MLAADQDQAKDGWTDPTAMRADDSVAILHLANRPLLASMAL